MSSTTCTSQSFVEGETLTCIRDVGHDSVHMGPISRGEHTDELMQWTDADSVDASAPVDDLPVWYSALPIGEVVIVETSNGYAYDNVQLTGAVLDDHEQLAALRLDYRDPGDVVQHVLLPWSRVNAIEWADQ